MMTFTKNAINTAYGYGKADKKGELIFMFSLDYQIEDLIREISANRYFKERYNTRDLREKIYNRQKRA